MRYSNLLQSGLSAPRPSSREDPTIAAQRAVFWRRPTGIHVLPVELLSRIFVLGAGLEYLYDDSPFLLKPSRAYTPPSAPNFQVLVSHVCHHWRQVALCTPSLWTTLHFREKPHISRAKEYLARCTRSSNYLLDILFDSVSEEDHTPDVTLYKDEVRTIFKIIVPHVKRWRSFHLKICDNFCKGLARQFLSACGPAPNLETLQLYHFEDYRTTQNLYLATYRPPVVVFENALPRLKNVSLIGVNLPWDKSPYLMNLRQLELALHPDNIRPPYRWWKRMLQLSPELETLCLHYSGPKMASGSQELEWPLKEEKISLPCLQELSLTDLDPDYLCILFERLNIPSVRSLTLDLPDQDFSPFLELITKHVSAASGAFISTLPSQPAKTPITSLSALETLVIHALECNKESWFQLLSILKRLKVLHVDFSRVGPKFWRIFTGNYATPNVASLRSESKASLLILPCLEVLKVTGISGADIITALHHRYRNPLLRPCFKWPRWIVGWTEQRRGADKELDALVDRGYWDPGSGSSGFHVIIEAFDPDEDDDENQGTDDEEQQSVAGFESTEGHDG